MEGLGQALLLLAEGLETDLIRINRIFANTYRSSVGIPCLWPRFDREETNYLLDDISEYYHNGRVWPFVQGYWAIAAARHGKVDVFAQEFEHLMKLSQVNNTFAEFYELDGSFPYERRGQLWSRAAFIGMVYYGLFGMELVANGIHFRPVSSFEGDTISLLNVSYRHAVLDIYLTGSGAKVKSWLCPEKAVSPGNVKRASRN